MIVLVDFPFATPAHRSGWYAALVSLLSRAAFAGSAPFFLFDANTSRVGKGLLTDLIAVISEGRRASRYSASKDGDEMRKAITTAAIGGVPYLLFDNIKGKFGGATLENAMTAGRWSDRVLGENRQIGPSAEPRLAGHVQQCRAVQDYDRPDVPRPFGYGLRTARPADGLQVPRPA